jgi:hypothetical protein
MLQTIMTNLFCRSFAVVGSVASTSGRRRRTMGAGTTTAKHSFLEESIHPQQQISIVG